MLLFIFYAFILIQAEFIEPSASFFFFPPFANNLQMKQQLAGGLLQESCIGSFSLISVKKRKQQNTYSNTSCNLK